MKNFSKFLEEVSINGNPGVPGQGDKKPGESNYLKDVESRFRTTNNVPREGMRDAEPLIRQFMPLLQQSTQMIRGKEDELEKLATDVISSQYGEILDGVELDIKLIRPDSRDAKNFMDENEDDDDPDMPKFRDIKDEDIIAEIHKRKIANNIMQGEAKNTKSILHSDEIKEGLKEIFGESDAKKIHKLWDDITKIAHKLDWIIPVDIKADMMEESPEAMAGAVRVEWKPKEKKDDDDEEKEEKEYSLEDEEGESEEEYHEEFTPVLRARGVDFPMLLHEAVKGVYELIAAVGIPEDEEVAKKVRFNTSSEADEAEEFRYGPEIAADSKRFPKRKY